MEKVLHDLSMGSDAFLSNFQDINGSTKVAVPSVSATRLVLVDSSDDFPAFVPLVCQQILFEIGGQHASPPVKFSELFVVAVHDAMTKSSITTTTHEGTDASIGPAFPAFGDGSMTQAVFEQSINSIIAFVDKGVPSRKDSPCQMLIALTIPTAKNNDTSLVDEPVVLVVSIAITYCFNSGGCKFSPNTIGMYTSKGLVKIRPLSTQTVHQLSEICSTHMRITQPTAAFSFLPTTADHGPLDETLVIVEIRKVEVEMIGTLFVRPMTSRSTDTNVGGPWNPIAESTSESTILDVFTVIGIDQDSRGVECFCAFVQSATLTSLCSSSETGMIQQAALNLVDDYQSIDDSSGGINAPDDDRAIVKYRCDDVRALALSKMQQSKKEEQGLSPGNVEEKTIKRKRGKKVDASTTEVPSTAVVLDAQFQLPLNDCPSIACDKCGKWRVFRGSQEELEALKKKNWDCSLNSHDPSFAACTVLSVYSEEQQGFETTKTKKSRKK